MKTVGWKPHLPIREGDLAVDNCEGYTVQVLSEEAEVLHGTKFQVRVLRNMGGPKRLAMGDTYSTEDYYLERVRVDPPKSIATVCVWCRRQVQDADTLRHWVECCWCKGE